MKFSTSTMLPLLMATAIARPTTQDETEGDPLPQTSRVTAFVVDEKGNPSVQCWEFSNMVNGMTIKRKNGSKAKAHSLTVATKKELEGIDIITWPSYSPIWPDPSAYSVNGEVKTDYLDLSNTFNLFNVQGGLINFKFSIFAAAHLDDVGDYTYQLENGDDWFYFEDNYTYSNDYFKPNAADSPFQMSAVSGSETETLRLRFSNRPAYKVLHKGACRFSGIDTPSEDSSSRNRRLHQQYEL